MSFESLAKSLPAGGASGSAKLTKTQWAEIYALCKFGGRQQTAVAQAYEVTPARVSEICRLKRMSDADKAAVVTNAKAIWAKHLDSTVRKEAAKVAKAAKAAE